MRRATAFQSPSLKGQRKIIQTPTEGLKPQPKPEEITFTKYLCPWCLTEHYLSQYLTHCKNGKLAKKGQCPNCGHRMLIDTLRRIKEYTIEEFAEWVYERGHYGFWKEIKFQEWKQRLYEVGFSQKFWGRYRELKNRNSVGGDEDADYADYVASNREKT